MSTTSGVQVEPAPAVPLEYLPNNGAVMDSPSTSVRVSLSDDQAEIIPAAEVISTTKTVIIISSVTAVTGIASVIAGIVTICLPAIARDIDLADDLLLW